ncbi:MAG: DMT family transporter [Bacteroidota bacterium]
MIYLISSIFASSCIFVIFKLFAKFKIDTLQAIVFNYITAFIFGFALYGKEFKSAAFDDLSWVPFVVVCGILFIVSFLVLGLSAQKNGVAMTSVSVKMSMAISMLLMILWYREPLSLLKILGMILALAGVVFMSISKNDGGKKSQKPIIWMLIFLFVAGGFLDFVLNYAQNNVLQNLAPSLFSAIGFGISGIIGLGIMFYSFAKKTSKFEWKNVLAGIILGFPNFFSIYLIMATYQNLTWNDSTILAVTNVSIVIVSAFTGFLAFKEQLNSLKIFGLIASVSAIVTLYFASL